MKKITQSTPIIETCEKVSKISIYLLVFLLPIFFLPWTANVLDFNKQALLIVLVFASIFAWILKILISGKARFNFSLVHIPIVVLFLIYTVSTIFSLWRYGSFWGWPQISSESLLSLIGLVLLYFLVINIFERKEIFYLVVTLCLSGFLAILYGGLQLFGKFLIPIDFTKAVSFNTIGGVNSLSVFTAVLLPLIIILITISTERYLTKGYLRIFFIVVAALSAILLLLINFQNAWWLVIAGSALIIVFGTQKRDIFDNRWLVLPMFFLALALLFSFFRFQIPGTPDRPIEVFLTQRTSFNIAWEALKDNPVIGSGPGTFIYNFSKYKALAFNQGSLWNIRFDWAGSKLLTLAATVGILGVLSFLTLIGFFIFYGIKFLFTPHHFFAKTGEGFKKKEREKDEEIDEEFFWLLGLGIFISFLTTTVLYFLYRSNLTLDFVWFLLMACFVSLLRPARPVRDSKDSKKAQSKSISNPVRNQRFLNGANGVKKEVVLKPSSLVTLGITFAFTLVFIFGLGILILEGQRYVAAVNYLESMKDLQQSRGINSIIDSLNHLETAIRISPKVDLYWREISQLYLQAMTETAARTDLSQAELTQQIQIYINSAVNSAKAATDTNPENVANWSVRGFIYQNLIGIVGGTKDWAVNAYEEALKLEPTNPFFPTQAGISILKEAGQDPKLLTEAQEKFEEAIELKSDYAPAHFQIAMVYGAQGEQTEMIEELEKTKAIAPFDVGLAFQLGLIYFQGQDYEKARNELERAVLLNSDYANALYFLGLTYDELGEKEMAIKTFEKILVANPGHSLVTVILKNLRTGEKALKGIVEEQPPIVPIEEEHPEIED